MFQIIATAMIAPAITIAADNDNGLVCFVSMGTVYIESSQVSNWNGGSIVGCNGGGGLAGGLTGGAKEQSGHGVMNLTRQPIFCGFSQN